MSHPVKYAQQDERDTCDTLSAKECVDVGGQAYEERSEGTWEGLCDEVFREGCTESDLLEIDMKECRKMLTSVNSKTV